MKNGNESPLLENEKENEINENSLEKYTKLITNYNNSIIEFNKSMIKPFIIKSRQIFDLKNEIKDKKEKLKNEIKNNESDIDSEIIKLRDYYIKEKQGINFDKFLKGDMKIILLINCFVKFSVLSVFHFFVCWKYMGFYSLYFEK